jgi:autotransporter-associated beta strand protein
MASLMILAIGVSTRVQGADAYWDVNGTGDGGSDSDVAPGTWGSDNFWSASDAGAAGAGAWVADDMAVFSAGTDVTGTYSVTVSGTQSASGMRFEEGTVTLTGGTVNLTNAGTVNVINGLTATVNSAIGGAVGLTKSGEGTLVLGGANTYSGNTILATNASVSPLNVLRLGASEVIPNASVVQIAGMNSAFELNGQTETVKSISGGGTGSRIDIGTGTLILDDLAGEVSAYQSQLFASTTGKIVKNGGGQINLAASNSGWDGEFVLNSGLLGIGTNNVLGTTTGAARLTLAGGTLTFFNAGSRSLQTPNVDITGSFTALMGASNFELLGLVSGGEGQAAITLKTANPTITVSNTTGTTGTFIFRGVVGQDVPGRGFTKRGTGVLTIANPNNSWSGNTTVEEGQLRIDANGRLGDGTGTVFLSGGNLATSVTRDVTTDPISNPITMTQDAAIVTVFGGVTPPSDVSDANFTGVLSGTAGTLTFRNDAPAAGANPDTQFEPRLSADFTFTRPIVIAEGLNSPTRTTRLSSANTGTQTFSGAIFGEGIYRRMAGGTTVFSGANTFTGGTEVEGGTLRISGASATAGGGNVTVTGGTLDVDSGVLDAIANAATLSISGTGVVNLDSGINDTIAGLILGGTPQTTPGTYGSSASGATFANDTFFTGLGRVTLASTAIAGDFDGDNDVDSADFNHATLGFKARFGNDLDGGDFLDWQRNFGTNVPPSAAASAAVPEPATVGLAALAVAWALGGATRRGQRHA